MRPVRHLRTPITSRVSHRAVTSAAGRRVVLVAVALLAALIPAAGADRVGAQAELVNVSVRTSPEIAEPGDDVTVLVRATGCPPGGSIVEVYLTSSDTASLAAALMAREEPPSNLFFRLHAEIELPNAVEGWYGVRVVCGQFRPERKPMANTNFRVGANPTKSLRLLGTQVVQGQSLRLEGDGCPGTEVEYTVNQGNATGAFLPSGPALPVLFDGSWAGDVAFSTELSPGPARVRVRCGLRNQFGDQVWINYDQTPVVEVLRSATVAPATTPTTVAPAN